jgi:DHA2 family multidrug resistance protein
MTSVEQSATSSARTVEVRDTPDRYPYVALCVVFVGTFMVVLDTTIVNVALPQIRDDLHAGSGIEWVVTGYLLAVAASQPATGWLADRFGRRRIFLSSLALFTTASLCCGLSPNLPTLIGFRVVQGLGGGALVPVGMAIVFEVFPPERRGHALGIWGVSAMAGPTIGPTIGGYLVTEVSWHWLFFVNVPVGIVAFTLGFRLLRDSGHRHHRPLDGFGLILGASGLAIALLGVSQGNDWGWGHVATLGTIGCGAILLFAFGFHELRVPQPIVELRMFRVHAFSIAMTVSFITSAAQFARLVFIPLELATLRGYTALRIGVLLIPAALATAASTPFGGRLVDRVGARVPVTIGCTIQGVALILAGRFTVASPVSVIIMVLCLQGVGKGLTAAPTTVAGMNALGNEFVSQASALRSLINQVAGAVAVAALFALATHYMGDMPSPHRQQAAYNLVFLVSGALVLAAAVLATRLPGEPERAHLD